jgi:lipopolysaccharide transport system permease protein
MAVQILSIGVVFGLIFGSPMEEFLPYLAASLILWAFISGSITEGSMGFVASEAVIRQINLPHWVHIVRSLWRNLIILGHNVIVIPIVFLFFLRSSTWNLLLVIPGALVTSLFLFFFTFTLATLTTRFRDIQQITASIMTVVFYVTPVIWQASLIPGGIAHLLLGLNPFYHFLQIVRLPILGEAPTLENWLLAVVATLVAGLVAFWTGFKYKNRLAYWL